MLDTVMHGLGMLLRAIAPVALPFALFGILERFWPGGALKSARGWALNLKICLLYLSVPTLMAGATTGLVHLLRQVSGGGLIDLSWAEDAGFARVALGSFVFLLAWDFFYYWWHRAQHELPFLWAMHKLHHMDETLGVTTEMRCHWLEEIGRILMILVPMALLFNLPEHAGFVAIALTTWSAFIHSNLRLGFGRWSAVLAGPQVHRIHHSIEYRHFDKNYAAFFPLYDVIFGSYHHPAPDEYPDTGVLGEAEVGSLWQSAILPFRAWKRRPDADGEVML